MSQTKAQLLDPQGDFTLNGTLIGVGATFSGNVSIAGTLTKQDVTNVDSVGIVTIRSGGYLDVRTGSSINTNATGGWASGTLHKNTNSGEFAVVSGGSGGNNYLTFYTSASAAPAERLRIDSSGFIHQKFASNNSTTAEGLFINNTQNTTGNNASLVFSNDSGNRKKGAVALIDAGNYGAGDLVFALDGADSGELNLTNDEKLRITSDGKLLVGTTSALDSFGSSVQYNAGTSGSFICLGRNDTTVAETNGIGGLRFYSNDTNINSGNYLRVGEINCSADGDFLSGDAPTKMTFSTVTDGTTTLVERLRIDSSGRLLLGTDTKGYSAADDLTIGNGSGNRGITIRAGTSSQSAIYFADGTSGDDEYRGMVFYKHDTEELRLASNAATALTLDSSQNATFSGTVSDSKGNLRSIPITWQNSNTYTLLASDAGKVVSAATNGTNITVPASVFSGGDTITLMNHTGNVHTITQGTGVTMYFATDGSTGNRSLAARGFCTLFYREHNVVYISGAGLS